MSPFEVDLGWRPISPIYFYNPDESEIKSVKEFRSRMSDALKDAQFSYEMTNARQSAYSASKYQRKNNKKGDRVWNEKVLLKYVVARNHKSSSWGRGHLAHSRSRKLSLKIHSVWISRTAPVSTLFSMSNILVHITHNQRKFSCKQHRDLCLF